MGAVDRPGVFTADTPTPRLVDLVERAGGLDENATGNVRIVRGGRGGQQTFYTSGLDYRLQPGDLVVVDARPEGGSRHRMVGANGGEPKDDGVQLALLELLDRPVVLRMRSKDASIGRILQLLGQSSELAPSVRVVETGPAYTRGVRDEMTQLAAGSVLIFDPSAVDHGRLPDLPPVIRHDADRPATPSAPRPLVDDPADNPPSWTERDPRLLAPPSTGRQGDVPATNASLARRPPPRLVAEGPAPNAETRVPLPTALDELTDDDAHAVEERPILPLPSFNADTAPVVAPTAGAESAENPRPEVSEETAAVPGPSFLDGGPEPVVGDLAKKPARSDDDAAVGSEAEEVDSTTGSDAGSLAIVLSVLVAAAVLIWLLSRRTEQVGSLHLDDEPIAREPTPSAPKRRLRIDASHGESSVPTPHVRPTSNSTLDDLIEGRVTFQEEPLCLPTSLEVYGKPTSDAWHRVDDEIEPAASPRPRRPHLVERLARSVATESTSAAEETAASPVSNPSSGGLEGALFALHGGHRS